MDSLEEGDHNDNKDKGNSGEIHIKYPGANDGNLDWRFSNDDNNDVIIDSVGGEDNDNVFMDADKGLLDSDKEDQELDAEIVVQKWMRSASSNDDEYNLEASFVESDNDSAPLCKKTSQTKA